MCASALIKIMNVQQTLRKKAFGKCFAANAMEKLKAQKISNDNKSFQKMDCMKYFIAKSL